MTRLLEFKLYVAGFCVHPECIVTQGGSLKPLRFPALCALIKHPENGYLLFDTGYSSAFFNGSRRFPYFLYRWVTPVTLQPQQTLCAQLAADGITQEQISHVFLSHFHGDHIAGVVDFPSATILCSHQGWSESSNKRGFKALLRGLLPDLLTAMSEQKKIFFEHLPAKKPPSKLECFTEVYSLFGDESLWAVSLPGHASGHFGLYFESKEGPIFFIADACWVQENLQSKNQEPHAITHLLLANVPDYAQTLAILRKFHEQHPEVKIIPSHCQKTLLKMLEQ